MCPPDIEGIRDYVVFRHRRLKVAQALAVGGAELLSVNISNGASLSSGTLGYMSPPRGGLRPSEGVHQ